MENNTKHIRIKLQAIREVQRASEIAMKKVITYIRTDSVPTSRQARKIIKQTLDALDCECPEGVIVAGGRKSAQPHAAGRGVLRRGTPIVIDIFPRSKKTKYFADMTRTVCLGKPSKKLRAMYNAVIGAQRLAFSLIKPGVRGGEVQRAVEKYFEQKGFVRTLAHSRNKKSWRKAEGFIHSIGHGIGQKIHQRPRFTKRDDLLQTGDVVSVEPGLYYEDTGGVRIEDLVVVTKRGCQRLSVFPKRLLI